MFEFTLTDLWRTSVASVAIFVIVVAVVRLNGLRTFSKMSSFDFAVTVAAGSILASVAVGGAGILTGLVALVVVIGAQRVVAMLRRERQFERVVDNTPVLLMANGEMLEDRMLETRVTSADLRAKLREANVLDISEVRAVVLETTGDISVLHGSSLDASLLQGVRGAERLEDTDFQA